VSTFRFAGLALALAVCAPSALAQHGNGWTIAATPAGGAARSIGWYANGCIRGAVALPLEGLGWRVLRPQRNRNWGHPAMIAALRESVALGWLPRMPQIFPVQTRVTGMALSYNISVPLFGGFAPLIAASLIQLTGSKLSPSFYLIGTALVSLAALIGLRAKMRV